MRYFISADGNKVVGIDGSTLSVFEPIGGESAFDRIERETKVDKSKIDKKMREAFAGKPTKRKYKKRVPKEGAGRSGAMTEEMKDDAVEWYEEGQGTDEIAEKLGVSRPTIVKALKERGVSVKKGRRVPEAEEDAEEAPEPAPKAFISKYTPEKISLCKKFLGEGMPMADVATETGLDESQVERLAVSMGL